MGQYHYLINLDKEQVVHPHQIGNGLKLKEQIGWEYSTSTALVMLLASASREGGRGGGDFRSGHKLVGSWAGDRIAFVGDYAESGDIPGFDASLIFRQCNAACYPEEKREKPEQCRHVFDVRQLSTWQAPPHPPYCTGKNNTPDNREAWERYWEQERQAIARAIKTAIERGELTFNLRPDYPVPPASTPSETARPPSSLRFLC